MTTAQLIFLYTAEERNITRAARRAFVSQQCASAHIRNLEEHYKTPLFNRKPSFSLTPAGQCLYDSLRELAILEKNTDTRIQEICQGAAGQLKIGINSTRARILMPILLSSYSMNYPNVQISLFSDDTLRLLARLKEGHLDLVVGVGVHAISPEHLTRTPLTRDSIYFVTTRRQLEQAEIAVPVSSRGIPSLSLHALARLPLCRNQKGSTLTNLIDRCLYREGISLHTRYYVSDYDTQLDLCSRHACSIFCPSMLISRVFEKNTYVPDAEKLLIFHIQELTEELPVDLIQNHVFFRPRYLDDFAAALSEAVAVLDRQRTELLG